MEFKKMWRGKLPWTILFYIIWQQILAIHNSEVVTQSIDHETILNLTIIELLMVDWNGENLNSSLF